MTRKARKPRSKSALPPSTPIACDARTWKRWQNILIPGRRGGVVVGCASPSRARPREGQLLLNTGDTIPKSRARDRLRKRPITTDYEAFEIARDIQRTGIPAPTGLPYPHRRGGSPCDPDHRFWEGYPDALEAARERAALVADDDASYQDEVRRALNRANAQWEQIARDCVHQIMQREKRSATQSATRQRAQARAAYVARGGDVTSAEYYDDVLSPLAGKRPRKRRARK